MNSIHNPTVKVKLRSGEVEVGELAWPAALKLYQRLMSQSKAFFDDKGQLVLDAARVISAIQENVELGTWLVLETCRPCGLTRRGNDVHPPNPSDGHATNAPDGGIGPTWLDQLTLSEALDVVTEAAVLNIGIIVERIKNARSRLSRACGMAGDETQLAAPKMNEGGNSKLSDSTGRLPT